MNKFFILFLILGLDALFLLYETSQLSIGYTETTVLNGSFSVLQQIEEISFYIFGKNDFALRFPMIILHLQSTVLLFNLSKQYLKYDRDRLWLVVVFILLPGVLSSSIVVNNAGLVIFSLFLYLNLYKINNYFSLILTKIILMTMVQVDSHLHLIIIQSYFRQIYIILTNIFIIITWQQSV